MRRFFTKLVACTLLAFLLCVFFNSNLVNAQTPPDWLQSKIDYIIEGRGDYKPTNLNSFGLTSQELADMRSGFSSEEETNYISYQRDRLAAERETGYQQAQENSQVCKTLDFSCQFRKLMGSWGIDVTGFGGFVISIINWILYVIVTVLSFALGLSATFLDVFVKMTMNIGSLVKSISAINTVWSLIRDTFNVTFIFMMLYIAIGTIIRSSKVNYKKMIISVLVSALLINFSMFFTKIAIDAGNLVALAFYNKITLQSVDLTETDARTGDTTTKATKVGISGAIMSGLNLETLKNISSPAGTGAGSDPLPKGTTLTTLLVFQIVLYSLLIWAFVTAGFLLLARTIAFLFLLATSPVGFVGDVVPKMSTYSKDWHKTLVDQILVAPIFMFLMFLLSRLIASGIGNYIEEVGKEVENIGGLAISAFMNFAMIVGFLIASVKITKSTSGKIGGMITDYAKSGIGLAAGLATGGAALAGRKVLGGFAANYAANHGSRLAAEALNGSRSARLALKAIDFGKNSTFDIRNNKTVGGLVKKTGVDLGSGNKSTYQGTLDKDIKKDDAFIKMVSQYKDAENNNAFTQDAKEKHEENVIREHSEHVKETEREQTNLANFKASKQAELANLTDPLKKAKEESKRIEEEMKNKIQALENRKISARTKNEVDDIEKEQSLAKLQMQAESQKIKDSQEKINEHEGKIRKEIDEKEKKTNELKSERIKALDKKIKLFEKSGNSTEQKERDAEIEKLTKSAYAEKVRGYANLVEESIYKHGKIDTLANPLNITIAARKERAKKIRGKAKEKTNQQKLDDAILARQKEKDEEDKKNSNESSATTPPTTKTPPTA